MRLKTSVDAWALSFSAFLGIGGVACGGESNSTLDSADDELGTNASSNASSSGGSASSGTDGGGSDASSSGGSASGGGSSDASSSATSTTDASGGSSAGGSGNANDNVTSGSGGSTAGSSTTGSSNQTCTNPKALGGTVMCDEGFYHRPSRAACPSTLPRDRVLPVGDGFDVGCLQDSDCSDAPHGHCEDVSIQAQATACLYGCVEDSDCDAGEICECGDPVGTCVAAVGCEVDSDCTGNAYCASFQGEGPCWWERVGYACQSEVDQCTGPSDCSGADGDGCIMGTSGRACQAFPWVCGRPFLVAGSERQASLRSNSDWQPQVRASSQAWDESRGERDGSAVPREALARRWAEVALMEHASVAAFARFTLQLLALGAPAELVAASQRASLDEVEHARACFGIASRFAGSPLGPGPLPADGVLEANELDLAAVLELVIREGCFGETLAALAATEGAARAVDTEIRSVLEKIARDEREHAALAWRTLTWALERADEGLRRHVAEVFRSAANAQSALSPGGEDEQGLSEYGLVRGSLWEQIRRQATARVILPLAEQLLIPNPGPRSRPLAREGAATA